ncbi:MAG: hypothetical protein RLZZ595_89 [Bacteroidota bacterium]
MKLYTLLIFLLLFSLLGKTQSSTPIGQWSDHVPFRFARSVFVEGETLTAATRYGIFRYSIATKEFERLTKSNNLSEVEIKLAEKDPSSSALLVVYKNENLDLVQGEQIKNVPDVLNSKVQGDKTINNAKWIGNEVYFSTNLGILVLNTARAEIKATYRIGPMGSDLPVKQIAVIGNTIYAATTRGLRKTIFDSISMRNYQTWVEEKITFDQEIVSRAVAWDNQLVVQKSDSVFLKEGNSWKLLYAGSKSISFLDVQSNTLYMGFEDLGKSSLLVFKDKTNPPQELPIASLHTPKAIAVKSGELWIADEQHGVIKFSNGKEEIICPNSPHAISTGKSFFYNNTVWTTAGRVENGIGKKFPGGFFQWNGSNWTNYTVRSQPFMDSILDVHTIAVQPETGVISGGSFGGGLFELDKNGGVKIFKQNSFLSPAIGSANTYQVGGLTYDKNQTRWISNPGSAQSIIAKTKQGDVRKFSIPQDPINNSVGDILIDSKNRKWILGGPNNGLVCFDDAGTLDRSSDDRWRFFRQGKGNGNLPSSDVLCVREDRNGLIWVGTNRGLAIIPCLDDVFNSSRCEAVLPIVQQNNVAGVLLSNEVIHDIEVDGADRKWIATANGVWLLSADGQQTVYRFTSKNSPLLSNTVYEITIDGKTGEVYFHTESGISVFRSTATEPEGIRAKASVFPNPVPSGFNGTIAIRNLPENAWVRIAELDGKLVYQTRSLGGQAIWNGRNYKGEKINSGVYLVYIADENNQQQLATKIFFIQ